ncbi:MAG TPA: cellulose synthase operon protein YhjQ/BcsQ [Terracidiphilus sp.]
MNESRVLSDLSDSPQTSSAVHPWTRPHGAKHRDFSASRLQARERARKRVQRAIEEERERAREQAQSLRAANQLRAAGSAVGTPQVSTVEFELSEPSLASSHETLWLQLEPGPATAKPPVEPHLQLDLLPELKTVPPPQAWTPADEISRPSWLNPIHAELSGFSMPQVPADSLQGARDRLASRWFALKGMFAGAAALAEAPAAIGTKTVSPAPVLAVFSLAGGVGKSSLAATLARTLSARGERVLLVETTSYGLLPFFFGASDHRPGVLRTFTPPEACADAPVQILAIDVEALPVSSNGDDPLAAEIARYAQDASRVIVDISTASTAVAKRVLRMSPQILVPVIPDMSAVVNSGFIDALFHRKGDPSAPSSEVCYVLNQYDSSLPLHLDVREVLRERLGDRLLPFILRRAPAVSEALAEGMTVVDYSPAEPVAEDFNSLAAWIKSRSAPAGAPGKPTRWTEK